MVKKLTRTGNSLALVFDKRLLDATGIDAQTPLEVSTDGHVIVVSPVRDRRRAARVKKIVAELHREYEGVIAHQMEQVRGRHLRETRMQQRTPEGRFGDGERRLQ